MTEDQKKEISKRGYKYCVLGIDDDLDTLRLACYTQGAIEQDPISKAIGAKEEREKILQTILDLQSSSSISGYPSRMNIIKAIENLP